MKIFILLAIISLFSGLTMLSITYYFRRLKRRRLSLRPFPSQWQNIIDKNVSVYNQLPESLKEELHKDIQIFLSKKRFEGCNGLKITDEIRVTIAAHACVLLLNRKTKYYPKLHSIIVYPHAYVGSKTVRVDKHIYTEKKTVRAGESWNSGEMVLAWDHVQRSALDLHEGHNLVYHEFAHQLDQEDGVSDGTPILEKRSSYASWVRVLGHEYMQLRQDILKHKKHLLDNYGATNPAEFFAVVTEIFFDNPEQLEKKEPELYNELKGFYKLDPVRWEKLN